MSFNKRLIITLMLSAGLTACGGGGGGNNNLFNPADTTDTTTDTTGDTTTDETDTNVDTSDSGITSLSPVNTVYTTNEFVGIFIERLDEEKEKYKLGTSLMKTLLHPSDMKENDPFEATVSYKFNGCQDNNLFKLYGSFAADSSLQNIYQDSINIDNQSTATVLKYFDVTWNGTDSAYYGNMQLAASEWIEADTCMTERYRLTLQSEVALFPTNAQFYSDTTEDVFIGLNENNQRQITWDYDRFTPANSTNKFYTVALYDYTRFDSLNFFAPIYALPADADEDQKSTAYALSAVNPVMTDDVFLWQDTIPGSSTSLTIPDSITLTNDNDYLLVVAAWESAGDDGLPSNKIYFFSSLTFKYKD